MQQLLCPEYAGVSLSEFDQKLLQDCLDGTPGSWETFTDRFLGLVLHSIRHTARARGVRLSSQDIEDYCADVFMAIIKDDFVVLRRFRGASSLATYLTVIARRVVVREFIKRKHPRLSTPGATGDSDAEEPGPAADTPAQAFAFRVRLDSDLADRRPAVEDRASNRDEVRRLLESPPPAEAEIVQLYHLDGHSYREISSQLGIPENSIGPTLSRAREKMRRHGIEV